MTPSRLAALEAQAHGTGSHDCGLGEGDSLELIKAVREKDAQIAKLRKALHSLSGEVDFVISGWDNEHDKCAECGLAGIGMLRDARREAVMMVLATAPEGGRDG